MSSYINKWWVGVTSEETFIHKRKIEHFKNSSMQKSGGCDTQPCEKNGVASTSTTAPCECSAGLTCSYGYDCVDMDPTSTCGTCKPSSTSS